MNSFIPWVGGKGKLLWIINKLMPDRYTRFIDVFGGSGTVTMCRPIQRGCMEVYNDFNGNLTNLFCCVKNRPMALLAELGFLPLNTRDDFNVLYKFFSKGEFTDDYLQEEMDLTEVYLKPPDAEAIRALMLERAPRGSIRRAADFFKLIRYSFSGGAKSFGGKPCDIRRFFHLIWECSRRLANVIVENKDFEEVIRQYDREGAVIYCDPPYYKAESCYEVEFPPEDHQRLHDVLVTCEGYFASQLPLLDGPEWDMDKQYKVASNVKPYQAAGPHRQGAGRHGLRAALFAGAGGAVSGGQPACRPHPQGQPPLPQGVRAYHCGGVLIWLLAKSETARSLPQLHSGGTRRNIRPPRSRRSSP